MAAAETAGAGVVAGFGILLVLYVLFILFMVAFSIFFTIVQIVMLIDAIKRDYKNENDKILWILVIALTGFVGAVIYYFVIKREDKH